MHNPSRPSARSSAKISASEILLIQTAFIGDVLLSIPLLKQIRSSNPEDKIIMVLRKGLGDLLLNLGLIDEFYEIEKGNSKSYKNLARELRNRRFRIIFCPHRSLRSAFFVSTLSAEIKIGFRELWSFFAFDQRIRRDLALPDSLRQMQLLSHLDADIKTKLSDLGDIFTRDEELAQVPEWASMSVSKAVESNTSEIHDLLNLHHLKTPFVVLAPGSVWATKRWTLEGYTEVAKHFHGKGMAVVLLGAQNEFALCQQLADSCRGVHNLAGKTTLWNSLLLLSQATLVFTNDSGSMHLAAMVDTPTVAVFGPTVLRFGFRPWQNKARVVQKLGLSCRPCGAHGPQVCPIGTHECMKSISAKEVIAVAEILVSL